MQRITLSQVFCSSASTQQRIQGHFKPPLALWKDRKKTLNLIMHYVNEVIRS